MRVAFACALVVSFLSACGAHVGPIDHASVFHYRMDELHKAFEAVHEIMGIASDQHHIEKMKKAHQIAKEVHAEAHPEG